MEPAVAADYRVEVVAHSPDYPPDPAATAQKPTNTFQVILGHTRTAETGQLVASAISIPNI